MVKYDAASNILTVTLKGSKCGEDKNHGIAERTLFYGHDGLDSIFFDYLKSNPGKVFGKAKLIGKCISDAGKRAWPKKKNRVTAYSFRHQFASDLKQARLGIDKIAEAMGHSVQYTQKHYGHKVQGRGGKTPARISSTKSQNQTIQPKPSKKKKMRR